MTDITRNNLRRRTLLGALAAGVGASALGQARPPERLASGPIRLIVGTPAGGTTDVVARMVAIRLADIIGQPVIVENKAGVSGLLAAEFVAKAPADGSTLLMSPSQLSTYRALYPTTTFQPERDLAPVGLVATSPYVLVVHPSLPVSNFAQLLAYAKAHPGALSYAGSNPGSAQHLGWEYIKRQAGLDMQYVAYKGTSALMPDLLAGRLQAGIDNVAILTPHIKSGRLRGIAVTGPTRSALLPELPTVAASGMPDFQALGWFGVFASSGTSPALLAQLRSAVEKTMATSELREKVAGIGAEPQSGGSDELQALLRREITTWTKVIQDSGITVQ